MIIQTASRKLIDLTNLKSEDIELSDIAHSLSRICRFNGHCHWWSVAQHSLAVADYVYKKTNDTELARAALFHDAHEAYIQDIIRPIRRLLLCDYYDIEDRLRDIMRMKFGYPTLDIMSYDDDILQAERVSIMGGIDWPGSYDPPQAAIDSIEKYLLSNNIHMSINTSYQYFLRSATKYLW